MAHFNQFKIAIYAARWRKVKWRHHTDRRRKLSFRVRIPSAPLPRAGGFRSVDHETIVLHEPLYG
jgi:hypothetical protein